MASLRLPEATTKGSILRCSGRLLPPDSVVVRVREMTKVRGIIVVDGINVQRGNERVTLWARDGIVELNYWTFGNVELVSPEEAVTLGYTK